MHTDSSPLIPAQLLGLGALIALASVPAAKAGVTEDLLALSTANKSLNGELHACLLQ